MTDCTANPDPGGFSKEDGSLPTKSLDELANEVSLERNRYVDYPDETHLSIRQKYTPDTVHYVIKVYGVNDPLSVLQTRGLVQDQVFECLSYLKLIHGDDLSGG